MPELHAELQQPSLAWHAAKVSFLHHVQDRIQRAVVGGRVVLALQLLWVAGRRLDGKEERPYALCGNVSWSMALRVISDSSQQ